MITTQMLFDGILTHIRIQGGHGPLRGYNTEKYDGCRVVWFTLVETGNKCELVIGSNSNRHHGNPDIYILNSSV